MMARPNAFSEMLSFEGRIRRLDWWLINIGIGFFTGLIGFLVTLIWGPRDRFDVRDFSIQDAVSLAINVAIAWPLLAASVKRSHDRGQSGSLPIANLIITWLVVTLLIVSPDAVGQPLGSWMLMGLMIVNGLIGVWLLVTLGFLDGTPGANHYGVSPKGVGGRNYQAPRND